MTEEQISDEIFENLYTERGIAQTVFHFYEDYRS